MSATWVLNVIFTDKKVNKINKIQKYKNKSINATNNITKDTASQKKIFPPFFTNILYFSNTRACVFTFASVSTDRVGNFWGLRDSGSSGWVKVKGHTADPEVSECSLVSLPKIRNWFMIIVNLLHYFIFYFFIKQHNVLWKKVNKTLETTKRI